MDVYKFSEQTQSMQTHTIAIIISINIKTIINIGCKIIFYSFIKCTHNLFTIDVIKIQFSAFIDN